MRRRGRAPRGGEGSDNGIPRTRARVAAREKLSTEVTEITVEARHILRDLRSVDSGASVSVDSGGDSNKQARGRTQRKLKSRIEDAFRKKNSISRTLASIHTEKDLYSRSGTQQTTSR